MIDSICRSQLLVKIRSLELNRRCRMRSLKSNWECLDARGLVAGVPE
jgi:hypothetical protein